MTIASEIQRIKDNIADAFDAAEAKGATMPVTENSDSLATTIESITGGGGEQVEAKNYTGANISEGDKVWINPYYYEAGTTNQVYSRRLEDFLLDEDGQYFTNGLNNSGHMGYFRINSDSSTTNILYLGNQGYCVDILYKNGARMFIQNNGTGPLYRVLNGNYISENSLPTLNDSEWFLDYTNGVYKKINLAGVAEQSIPVDTSYYNPSSWSSYAKKGCIKINDETLLIPVHNFGGRFYIYKLANGTLVYDNHYIQASLGSRYLGVTSDNKFIITDTGIWEIDLDNFTLTNVTPSVISDIKSNIYQGAYRFNQNGEYLEIYSRAGYSNTYTYQYALFKYNSISNNWEQISIESSYDKYVNCVVDNCNIMGYTDQTTSSGKIYRTFLTAISGNNLIPYGSQVTSDTQTGSAAESIAAGATGLVNVGAVIEPTGSITITTNGTHDVADYAEAVVNVPVPAGDKYKVGDRVNDDSDNPVGTVSSIFTDGNGDRYAVVCLDAVNRLASGQYLSSNTRVTNIPVYPSTDVWSLPQTSTTNTSAIIATGTSSACSHCRSKTFTIDGVTYSGQLPNLNELLQIFAQKPIINNQDPTASSYPSLTILSDNRKSILSSTQYSDSSMYYVSSGEFTSYANKNTSDCFVIPVLEIPLED